ncbi:Uncharacterized protein FWK35_00005019, partial [Aphis craccivora]
IKNFLSDFNHFDVWDDFFRAHFLTYNTESLMYGYNNNSAELYNSILIKFTNEFFMKTVYQLRWNATVTAYNAFLNLIPLFHKHVTKKTPRKFTKLYLKRHTLTNESRRRSFGTKKKNF